MINKEKLDDFLKGFDIELTDWQKDILMKMLEDPDRYRHAFLLARGSGYSYNRVLCWMINSVLLDCQMVKIFEQTYKDMYKDMTSDSLRRIVENLRKPPVEPDGYLPQLYLIDESPYIEEDSDNRWRLVNPMITLLKTPKITYKGEKK